MVMVMNNQDVVIILSKISSNVQLALRLSALESVMKRLTK